MNPDPGAGATRHALKRAASNPGVTFNLASWGACVLGAVLIGRTRPKNRDVAKTIGFAFKSGRGGCPEKRAAWMTN